MPPTQNPTADADSSAAPAHPRRATAAFAAGILALCAMAAWLRVRSLDAGLPWAYNSDEEAHFVPLAVAMVGGGLDPHYFFNPPGFTEMVALALKLRLHADGLFSTLNLSGRFRADPTPFYETGRAVAAALGVASVAICGWAGARLLGRRAGLVAAAVLACAAVPVVYGHLALDDAPALAPVALVLGASAGVLRGPRRRDWMLAGIGIGAGAAIKYTAIDTAAVTLIAAVLAVRARRMGPRTALLGLAGAALVAGICFLVLNPYALLDFHRFLADVREQARESAGVHKLGRGHEPGWLTGARTLTYGLGWAPLVAAGAGALVALRTHRGELLLLAPVTLVVFAFLGGEAQVYARWLLPLYPPLVMLAGFGAATVAGALARALSALAAAAGPRRVRVGGGLAVALTAVLGAGLSAQGLASSIHVDRVLSRTDTRLEMRRWLFAHLRAGSEVVVEPFLPLGYLRGVDGKPRVVQFPVLPRERYPAFLSPGFLDLYRSWGFCWVVSASSSRDRGVIERFPGAIDYYRRLDAGSRSVASFSPYRRGARPVPFDFDLSFDNIPEAVQRPGPLIEVRRLRACREHVAGHRARSTTGTRR